MKKSKKRAILILTGFLSSVYLSAQVGINTNNPHSSAALEVTDLNSIDRKGVLIPRMNTATKLAIIWPATGLIVYDTEKECLSQNVGTESSPEWICLEQKQNRFFYMPSIAIQTSSIGPVSIPIDLYEEYKKQFNTPMASSSGAPTSIPYFPEATDLNYYITYYDDTVIDITDVSDDGKVSYEIIKTADYNSFMNVIFVIK